MFYFNRHGMFRLPMWWSEGEDGGTPPPTPTVEELQKELTKVRQEAAERRVKAKELEDANKALTDKVTSFENEKLTEAEKLKAENEEAKKKLEQAQAGQRRSALKAEVALKAAKLNIVDADTALKLLDSEKVKYTESGDPENVEELLTALVKDKPFLVSKQNSGGSITNPQGGTGVHQWVRSDLAGKTTEQINEAFDKGNLANLSRGA